MELDWERQRPPRTLSLEDIFRLLEDSGVRPSEATLIEEGLANTNYKLKDVQGRYYHLRLAQRTPENLLTEVAVMRAMEGRLPVPKVLFASAEQHVFLSEWAPGTSLQRSDPAVVLKVGRQLGELLAALASKTFPQPGFLNSALEVAEPWQSVYDGLRGFFDHVSGTENCRERAPEGALGRLRKCWDRCERRFRDATPVACLSHSDFKPSNILIDQDRVSAVLDWEFSHAGTWLLDAGQLLRYQGDHRAELIRLLNEGLKDSGIDIPPLWPTIATLIDTASLCDFLSRDRIDEKQLLAVRSLLLAELDLVEASQFD